MYLITFYTNTYVFLSKLLNHPLQMIILISKLKQHLWRPNKIRDVHGNIYTHTRTHIYNMYVCIVFHLIYYDDVKIIISDHRQLTPAAFHRFHIILCIL